MKTMLLDAVSWDLVLDASGDIAVATVPYQWAQDAGSAIRLFQGELYYDTSAGVPYWGQILGKRLPTPLLKAYFVTAALTVPGVVSARCFLATFTDREVSGQVQVTDETGLTATAGF